LPQHSQN